MKIVNNNRKKKTHNNFMRKKLRNKTKKRSNNPRGGDSKSFSKAQCAPNSKKLLDFSCYDENALLKMRDLWNIRHKKENDNDNDSERIIESKDPKIIWDSFKKFMENSCKNEICWLKQKFMENNIDNELLTYTFAPKSPVKWKENHTTWLNSTDIERVMAQYEHAYPCFRFIGPTPIDFNKRLYNKSCVWDDLCNFDLIRYINKGVNKIGIIFNTDPHTKGGSHWISMFINVKKGFIFFFDSNGTKAPKEVDQLSDKIIKQASTKGIKLIYDQNYPFNHQEGNTECGMYSLFFIISLLSDAKDCNFFKTTKIKDDDMENLRDKYFNKAE